VDRKLASALEDAGYPAHTTVLGDGSTVLLLPHGGRILGLFAGDDPRNFLWTNPLLEDAVMARNLFSSEAWHNSGGDRTWLAPEIDFFLPRYPDTSVYHQPRVLDPGNFRLEFDRGFPILAMEFSVTPLRHGQPIWLRLSKSVGIAENPLHSMPGAQFAGYTLNTILEILGDPCASTPIGLWSLLQMPHGGEMILPAWAEPEVRTWFGEVPAHDLRLAPSAVHYFMRGKGAQKLGLRAVASTGRAGYFYELRGEGHLVIREFSVSASGQYVDAPWDDPEETGYAVQVCNVNNELGQFSELEYHVPAIGGATCKNRSEDSSQVWAYRGNHRQLSKIAEQLLGTPLTDPSDACPAKAGSSRLTWDP
jgi:hypothetical protein